jgi:hypothetical protein
VFPTAVIRQRIPASRLFLRSLGSAELHAPISAKSFMLQMIEPATINSEQAVQAYARVSDVATRLYLIGIAERNIARLYGDFQDAPADSEL